MTSNPTQSYCGIQCRLCPVFQANQCGTVHLLAEERGVEAHTLVCHGCKSDTCSEWCTACSIKACAKQKGIGLCHNECVDYPCDKIHSHSNVPVLRRDSYCGLFCGACEIFIANQEGTTRALAAERNVPEEQLFCMGCKTRINSVYCRSCEVKRCAQSKGHEFCHQCSDYPCAALQEFASSPHRHKNVVMRNLDYIRQHGCAAWIEAQTQSWRCPGCQRTRGYYEKVCRACGHQHAG